MPAIYVCMIHPLIVTCFMYMYNYAERRIIFKETFFLYTESVPNTLKHTQDAVFGICELMWKMTFVNRQQTKNRLVCDKNTLLAGVKLI